MGETADTAEAAAKLSKNKSKPPPPSYSRGGGMGKLQREVSK